MTSRNCSSGEHIRCNGQMKFADEENLDRVEMCGCFCHTFWRCFHCGEAFGKHSAPEHFGPRDDASPPTCISTRHPLVVSLRAKLAEAEQQREKDVRELVGLAETLERGKAQARIRDLEAEVTSLREKLEPFAAYGRRMADPTITRHPISPTVPIMCRFDHIALDGDITVGHCMAADEVLGTPAPAEVSEP